MGFIFLPPLVYSMNGVEILNGELREGVEYKFVPEYVSTQEVIGKIVLSTPIEPQYVTLPDFVDIIDADWPSGVAKIRIEDGESRNGNIALRADGERGCIPILSAPVYYAVDRIISGSIEEAEKIIRKCYSSRPGWGFRGDCRDVLQFNKFVELLDTVAVESELFSHIQFRSALGYFAKRIGDKNPQGIHSFEILNERVDKWNEAENLEEIALPEVLGEKLGRNWFRGDGLSSERQELLEIGFDPIEYDPDWDTPLPACWIAHTVLTEGIEKAEEYVRDRPTPSEDDYKKAKSEAKNLREKRGAAWGKVLALTKDEFRHDAQNYLYWIGRDYHRRDKYQGKAKIEPLLFAGAKKLSPEHVPPRFRQNIEFREKDSIGHQWRRDNQKEMSLEAFREARKIALGENSPKYEVRPAFLLQAESSIAHMEASRLNDKQESIDRYEEGIEKIAEIREEYDIPVERALDEVNFLQEQKGELL
jgi:hypothetical protein